jgi:tetratricopeptide (TPR) repeat protein
MRRLAVPGIVLSLLLAGGILLPVSLSSAQGPGGGATTRSGAPDPVIRFPSPDEPAVTSGDVQSDRGSLRALWFTWESQFTEGDLGGAKKTVDEIRKEARRLGASRPRLTEMALSAVAVSNRARLAGKDADAIAALEAASSFDPTLPDAEFAQADAALSRKEIVKAAKHYALGAGKIFQNVVPRKSAEVSFGIILGVTCFCAGLIVWLALLIRHSGSVLHDVHEMLDERLGEIPAAVVGWAFLFAPVFLGFSPPWAICFSLVVLWGYANPFEKITATFAQILLALSPVLLVASAGQAVAIRGPVYVGAVDLTEQRYDPAVIERLEELNAATPGNAELWYLLGSLYRDAGRINMAQRYFRQALEIDKTFAEAAVNLGVVLYIDGDVNQAIASFKLATEIKPTLAVAHYNLSVAYNENANFKDGSDSLNQAKALDPVAVSRWHEAGRDKEIRLQSADLGIDRARAKSVALEGDIGAASSNPWLNGASILLYVFILATPVVWWVRRKKWPYAGACVKCGRTYCRKCKAATESGIYCSQCVHIFLKKDGVAIDTKMQKVEDVKHFVRREEVIRRWSSIVFPGVAQALSGQSFRGLSLGFGFFFFLSAAFLVGRLYRPVVLPTRFFDFIGVVFGLIAFGFWIAANFRVVRPVRVEQK